MKLINPAFLRVQPVMVILAITVLTHVVLKPLYAEIDNDPSAPSS